MERFFFLFGLFIYHSIPKVVSPWNVVSFFVEFCGIILTLGHRFVCAKNSDWVGFNFFFQFKKKAKKYVFFKYFIVYFYCHYNISLPSTNPGLRYPPDEPPEGVSHQTRHPVLPHLRWWVRHWLLQKAGSTAAPDPRITFSQDVSFPSAAQ